MLPGEHHRAAHQAIGHGQDQGGRHRHGPNQVRIGLDGEGAARRKHQGRAADEQRCQHGDGGPDNPVLAQLFPAQDEVHGCPSFVIRAQ
jgi:hypothetical protein